MIVAAHGNVQILKSATTWTLETLNCLRNWLFSCVSSHLDCANLKVIGRLPLRLIDVGTTGVGHRPLGVIGSDEFNRLSLDNLHDVRIVSAAQSLPADTNYLTLSHRWGSPPSILLTSKTSFLLTDDISPHLLRCIGASVFRQAIHVTRALGFRYIWIDALCIMQDDDQEKLAEIIHMDEVYCQAVLNISAVEGQSSGLEFARDLPLMNPCRSIVQIPGSQECVDLLVFPERWFLCREEGPLNNRGWVFQERMLAPRLVQFAKDQAFWECRSLLASEVLPQGLPYAKSLCSDKGVGIDPDSNDIQEVKLRWFDLVGEYSRTLVTFPDDRLLAVSAVAKRFCHAMLLDSSDYVAGMWKDDLPRSMYWRQEPLSGRAGPEPTSIGREMKHAPSWSWASVFAPISAPGFYFPWVANTEVLGVEVTRKSPNFFDGTESCRIRLRGALAKLTRYLRNGETWAGIGHDAEFQEFHEYESRKGINILIYWDTARKITSNEFFSLHIGSTLSPDGRSEEGVVLCRTIDRGVFSRVGSFTIGLGSGCVALDVVQTFQSSSHLLSEDDFLERRLSGKCVIDVI